MPSIAVVNIYKKHEGVTAVARSYLKALRRLGFEVTFYQCVEGDESDYDDEATHIRGLKLPIRYIEKGINRAMVYPLKLKSIAEDLILLSDPWLLNTTFARDNVIVLVHDLRLLTEFTENSAQTMIFRALLSRLNKTRHIISISETTKKSLVALGIEAAKISVIPDSTEIDVVGKEHQATSIKKILKGEPLNVVYVANDIPYKNARLFAEIAKGVSVTSVSKHFRFTLLSDIKRDTLQYSDSTNLTVLRRVAEISGFYKDADVLLFPSNYEGFGIPLIESMKSGIPIIAKQIPTTQEVLDNGGEMLNTDNQTAWISSLTKLYSIDKYTEMSERALKRYQYFTEDRFLDRVKSVFSTFF